MPVPPGSAVDGQQVDAGVGGPFQRHGQLAHGISAGLEGDALGAEAPQTLDFLRKGLLIDKAEA